MGDERHPHRVPDRSDQEDEYEERRRGDQEPGGGPRQAEAGGAGPPAYGAVCHCPKTVFQRLPQSSLTSLSLE